MSALSAAKGAGPTSIASIETEALHLAGLLHGEAAPERGGTERIGIRKSALGYSAKTMRKAPHRCRCGLEPPRQALRNTI